MVVGGRDGVQGGGRWIKVWGRWDVQVTKRKKKTFSQHQAVDCFLIGDQKRPYARSLRDRQPMGWTTPQTLNPSPARRQAEFAELSWEASLFFCSLTPLPFPLVLLLTANLCFYITVVTDSQLILHLILPTFRSMMSDFVVPPRLCL